MKINKLLRQIQILNQIKCVRKRVKSNKEIKISYHYIKSIRVTWTWSRHQMQIWYKPQADLHKIWKFSKVRWILTKYDNCKMMTLKKEILNHHESSYQIEAKWVAANYLLLLSTQKKFWGIQKLTNKGKLIITKLQA